VVVHVRRSGGAPGFAFRTPLLRGRQRHYEVIGVRQIWRRPLRKWVMLLLTKHTQVLRT